MINLANEIDIILFIIIGRQKKKLGSENSILSRIFLNIFRAGITFIPFLILCMHSSKYINCAFYVHFTLTVSYILQH